MRHLCAAVMFALAIGAHAAWADHSAAKQALADQVMAPIEAFAAKQIEEPLTATMNDYKTKLRQEYPDLYARNEKEVHSLMRQAVVQSIISMTHDTRLLFLELFTEAELKRLADRMDDEGWRPADLRMLVKWPEFSAGMKKAREDSSKVMLLMLSTDVIPRMKEMGFFADQEN